MRIFYLLAAILTSAAIVILLGLTPDRISADILSLMHRDRSLKYKVDLMQPRKECFTMIGLVLANYPLIFLLNADWFSVLTDTFLGQVVNCVVALTIVVVVALTYKYTQPIEYKR